MTQFQTIFMRVASLAAILLLFADGASVQNLRAQNLTMPSTSYLRVADPRGAWNRQGQGRIEEAQLGITPCGAYTQCDLFLTFSSRGTTLTSEKDSLEVQFDFFLPQEAHITDSWLWVGNDIIQAKIFDRTSATNVYETIVQRRRDPSLLTKNSAGYFNLRIFPMRGNETRKVKISYLLPTEWVESSVYAMLPVSILKASSVVPSLSVIYYPQSDWTTPRLTTQRESGFGATTQDVLRETRETQTGRRVYAGTVSAESIRSNITAALEWQSPAQNGVFVQTFRQGNEQFYHIVVNARQVLGVGKSDNIEIDNMRLSGASGAAYDRYLLNLPPVSPSYYYGGLGLPSTGLFVRPGVNTGNSSLYAPFSTFRGTPRIDRNGIIQELGRMSGAGGSVTMRLGGYVNNVPFGVERTVSADAMKQGGDCGFQAWLGNYIIALENEPIRYNFTGYSGVDTAYQNRQRRIIKLSVENRILSRSTAFLALEPNDTTQACATCTQPGTGGGSAAAVGAPSGSSSGAAASSVARGVNSFASSSVADDILYNVSPISLKVSPNPSNGAVVLTMVLAYPADIDVASIRVGIYDALGRCIRILPSSVVASWLKQGQVNIAWDGDDDSGRRVAAGVYFFNIQTPTMRQTAKILRWE